jgi:4-amino-4-deoxy-L-arabinose transferase-like glycosyltransferase
VNPVSPRHLLLLSALLVFWALYGMVGRDAWHGDEARILNDLLDWRDHGQFPAGSASPLYTLLTGLGAQALAPWFTFQDAARASSGLFTLATLLLTGLAAREFFGRGYGAMAALAIMGAFGLLLRAHALLPGIALLAGYALLIYGVALARRNAPFGAAALGLGLAAVLLLRSVPDLVAGLLIVGLPLLSREWRTRPYRKALHLALLWLAGTLAAWLLLLASQGAEALSAWWQQATLHLQPERHPGTLLKLLSWFAWPLWPLALWMAWNEHRRLARVPALHPILIATAVLAVLSLWQSDSLQGGALPLLMPLALLAAHGLESLRRGAAQGFYWFGVLCFVFFLLAFWLYFAAIQWGWPTPIAGHMARLSPGYRVGAVSDGAIAIAAIASFLWLAAIPLFPRAKVRPILVWATGMLLSWILLISLFKPWSEESWGYRPVIDRLSQQLPAGACLRAEADPAMTAMLRYHLGARYRPAGKCTYWLRLTGRNQPAMDAGTEVWSGYRPRSKDQVYRLYRRDG